MIRQFAGVLILACCFAVSAQATTVNAASCSNAAFVTAIGTAVTGDTVLGPGGTDTGGGTRIDIPNTKGIIVDGGGCTINWGFGLTTNATTGTRITNFTFTKNGDNSGPGASFKTLGTSLTNAKWRLDHCTFTGNGSNIIELGPEPGLVDHITMNGGGNSDEVIHITAWGDGDNTGWTTAMPSTSPTRASGASEAIYFEDNTFSASSYSNAHATFAQGYYGARTVWRYNTLNFFKLDMHGGNSDPNIGARWWEYYNNDFHEDLPVADGGGSIINRDGSGIVFNNTRSGTTSVHPVISFCSEKTGSYPRPYQIGRGTGAAGSQVLDPAAAWNNAQSYAIDGSGVEALCDGGAVSFNRDIYDDVDSASCTAGGACTSGVGSGTPLPTTSTTGVYFWKTDAGGNWDTTHGGSNDGALYKSTSTNTFTLYYTPFVYPYPLDANGLPTTAGGGSPSITSLTPNNGNQGAISLSIAVVGSSTNFVNTTTVCSFGANITINSCAVSDSTHLTASITISAGASTGARDATFTTGAEVATATSGFTVNSGGTLIKKISPRKFRKL